MTWATRNRVQQYVRDSLWIAPLVGVLLGVLGALVVVKIDQATHLPLMISYEGVLPRMMVNRPGQRPTPEEIEKMRSEPPQTAVFEVRYSEYKKVDGVLLPHLVTTGANGNVTEEWTIEKFKLNPALKPESFVKKGS